ncbi:hypothetical protein DPMN_045605 [Dreissena polymorpha]|uniref:Uncharacterized protein n=1 Tax=Dreissena polymorpha TaxID=45954 RepID=A0A9D4D4G2_DREPO|nr:hypothetical protein DPMN_045605 [Dreissena polymorpha]
MLIACLCLSVFIRHDHTNNQENDVYTYLIQRHSSIGAEKRSQEAVQEMTDRHGNITVLHHLQVGLVQLCYTDRLQTVHLTEYVS